MKGMHEIWAKYATVLGKKATDMHSLIQREKMIAIKWNICQVHPRHLQKCWNFCFKLKTYIIFYYRIKFV